MAPLLIVHAPLAAQLRDAPPDWRWALDRAVPDSEWRFVMMPPGYHVTTGPGVTLYHPAHRVDGVFAVESEIFLFPSTREGEYGIFLGGADLGGGTQRYVAFVARRDGAVAVLRRAGGETTAVVPWARPDSAALTPASEPARNVLRVTAEPRTVTFTVNGREVARLARDSIAVDGLFGFRMGAGVNAHVATLDVLRKLAPPRPERPAGS
jgi:hypothetical protein